MKNTVSHGFDFCKHDWPHILSFKLQRTYIKRRYKIMDHDRHCWCKIMDHNKQCYRLVCSKCFTFMERVEKNKLLAKWISSKFTSLSFTSTWQYKMKWWCFRSWFCIVWLLGLGLFGLISWILVCNMPHVQDWSPGMLTCSPAS